MRLSLPLSTAFSKRSSGSLNVYSIGIVTYCFSSRNIINYTTAVLQHWQFRCYAIDGFRVGSMPKFEIFFRWIVVRSRVSRYSSMSCASSIRIIIVLIVGIVDKISRMLLNNILVMSSGPILFIDCFSITGPRVDDYLFCYSGRFIIGVDHLRFPIIVQVSSRRSTDQLSIAVFVVVRLPIV